MIKIARHVVAPVFPVAAMLFFAAMTGCEKDSARAPATSGGATNVVSRIDDPAYRQQLQDLRKDQVKVAQQQSKLRPAFERMLQRARKALPADAKPEQVMAELDAHPGKYPGWIELKAELDRLQANLKQEQQKTRDAVRARIQKEAADRKAAKQ